MCMKQLYIIIVRNSKITKFVLYLFAMLGRFHKLTPSQITALKSTIANIQQQCEQYNLPADMSCAQTLIIQLQTEIKDRNLLITQLADITNGVLDQVGRYLQTNHDLQQKYAEVCKRNNYVEIELDKLKEIVQQLDADNYRITCMYEQAKFEKQNLLAFHQQYKISAHRDKQVLERQKNCLKKEINKMTNEIEIIKEQFKLRQEKLRYELSKQIKILERSKREVQDQLKTSKKFQQEQKSRFSQMKQSRTGISKINPEQIKDMLNLKDNDSIAIDQNEVKGSTLKCELEFKFQSKVEDLQLLEDSKQTERQHNQFDEYFAVQAQQTQPSNNLKTSIKRKLFRQQTVEKPKCQRANTLRDSQKTQSNIMYESLHLSQIRSNAQLRQSKCDSKQKLDLKSKQKLVPNSKMSRIKFLLCAIGGNTDEKLGKIQKFNMRKKQTMKTSTSTLNLNTITKLRTTPSCQTLPPAPLLSTRMKTMAAQ